MKKINPNKVSTKYYEGISPTYPIEGRHYTLTHSDTTGNLLVIIGPQYAYDQISSMGDEVLLEWRMQDSTPYLYGEVFIDGENISGNPAIRNAIFIKEIPTALQAVRYGDQTFFEVYPELDHAPIYIDFISSKPQFNNLRYFGPIHRYQLKFVRPH